MGNLIFNKFDDREHSDVPNNQKNEKKIGVAAFKPGAQEQIHKATFAGRPHEHHYFNPKDGEEAQATGFKADAGRQVKFQMLAGSKNRQEKWWYNEGPNCAISQQGLQKELNLTGKVGAR